MKLEIRATADAAGVAAARFIGRQLRGRIAESGRATLALSGGSTPLPLLLALASEDVPWRAVDVLQTDERVAARGTADRNLTQLETHFLGRLPEAPHGVHPMPVESGDDAAAVSAYARVIEAVAGAPLVLDVVHLGLGSDGHTASLVPDDPVLDVTTADFAFTGTYHGLRRMTLTFPAIDRARCVVWLVTGSSKRDVLMRLVDGDTSIPAGRVARANAVAFADRAAASLIEQRKISS